MPVCNVCGTIHYYSPCASCYKLYQEDLAAGLIPPQFKEAGEEFTYYDWECIRVAEKRPTPMARTPEAREETRKRYVRTAIEGRLRAHRIQREKKDPQQERAKKDAEIRGRYTY